MFSPSMKMIGPAVLEKFEDKTHTHIHTQVLSILEDILHYVRNSGIENCNMTYTNSSQTM